VSEIYEFAKAFRFVVEEESAAGSVVLQCSVKYIPGRVNRLTVTREWIESNKAAGYLIPAREKTKDQEAFNFQRR
jgi:hypothetical protein